MPSMQENSSEEASYCLPQWEPGIRLDQHWRDGAISLYGSSIVLGRLTLRHSGLASGFLQYFDTDTRPYPGSARANHLLSLLIVADPSRGFYSHLATDDPPHQSHIGCGCARLAESGRGFHKIRACLLGY